MVLNKQRLRISVRGQVRGVGFRHHAKECAQSLGLVGYVQNDPIGGVICVVEGDEISIEHFVGWCHKGPPFAQVESLETTEERYKEEFDRFDIR